MVNQVQLVTDTALAHALQRLIVDLHARLQLGAPIRMVIAGGMAVHLYTGGRVTTDVDAEFSKKIHLPPDLLVETSDGAMLYLDANYNSSFALMHEDYLVDAIKAPFGTDLIEVFVLNPIDLVVSKIARFSGPDAADIEALIHTFQLSAADISQRAEDALAGYVGNLDRLKGNLRVALQIAGANA